MSPFEKARAVYSKEANARSFEADLQLHFEFGFVFSTTEFFVMGRPVDSTADKEMILNPAFQFRRAEADCWMVWLASGDLAKAWRILPYPLKWMAFERRNDLRFVELARIQNLSRIDSELLNP